MQKKPERQKVRRYLFPVFEIELPADDKNRCEKNPIFKHLKITTL